MVRVVVSLLGDVWSRRFVDPHPRVGIRPALHVDRLPPFSRFFRTHAHDYPTSSSSSSSSSGRRHLTNAPWMRNRLFRSRWTTKVTLRCILASVYLRRSSIFGESGGVEEGLKSGLFDETCFVSAISRVWINEFLQCMAYNTHIWSNYSNMTRNQDS